MKKIFDSLLDASEIVESVRILWDAPEFALSLAIHGLLIGAVFALAAYGLALVWGVMNVRIWRRGTWSLLVAISPGTWPNSAFIHCSGYR